MMKLNFKEMAAMLGDIPNKIEISRFEYEVMLKKAFLYDLICGFKKAHGYVGDEYIVDFRDTEVKIDGDDIILGEDDGDECKCSCDCDCGYDRSAPDCSEEEIDHGRVD